LKAATLKYLGWAGAGAPPRELAEVLVESWISEAEAGVASSYFATFADSVDILQRAHQVAQVLQTADHFVAELQKYPLAAKLLAKPAWEDGIRGPSKRRK
jgi:hypothetical protein